MSGEDDPGTSASAAQAALGEPLAPTPGETRQAARREAEAMVRLRPKPPQVMRLSPKAVAVLVGLGCAAIAGALAYGLRPSSTEAPVEPAPGASARPGEILANAPRDYSQVPRLGPPLPGDLGRPILSARGREDGTDGGDPMGGADKPAPSPKDGNGAEARRRLVEEKDAARASRLFVAGESASRAAPAASEGGGERSSTVPAAGAVVPAAGSAAVSSANAARQAFLANADARPRVSAARLVPAAGGAVLQAGSVIPAALLTGIRSDLPGQITAQVTENVHDSLTGHLVVIPQGSRLIGEYDAGISMGQRRALLVWTRLFLPDGRSLDLDRLPGADPSGQAGLEDHADYHWGGVFRAAVISTLLGIGSELGSGDDSTLVRALRQGNQDSVNRVGAQIVSRELSVPPTITIRPGHPVRVIVTRDLVFDP